jgi:hypothetical protein
MIYQHMLTWISSMVSRTILKAALVAVAFVAVGKFVAFSFAMLASARLRQTARIAKRGNRTCRDLRSGRSSTERLQQEVAFFASQN